MSLGPLLPVRLPNSLSLTRLASNLARQNRTLSELQDQLATGQKFFLPGESPAAAVRTMFLQRQLERRTQLETNVGTNQSMLTASETSLTTISGMLNQAKGFSLAGIGDSASPAEREAMAVEVRAMLQGAINAANVQFRGRFLFAGSESRTAPFEDIGGGIVRYNGDTHQIQSYADFDLLMANNVDGASAFQAMTQPITRDVNPALTLETRISDLLNGQGVALGPIEVTVDDGINPVSTQRIDLSGAVTVGDIKTRIEAAFPPGSVTVDIDPATSSGLRLQAATSVEVADIAGSSVAAHFGIRSAPAAAINGGDLDPRLSELTTLAALNSDTGIGPTAGTGLLITNGTKSATIDLSTAVTVEDVFNQIRAADLGVDVGINAAGNGIAVSGRLSNSQLTIGENGGTNATLLGIRTLDGSTRLADLNEGRGVPVDDVYDLNITRRDGTAVTVDLAGLKTVQQVIDAVNAVDPGNLVASLNAVGNGIALTDNSGTGPLAVEENALSVALGMNGTEPGSDPLVALSGQDVNPQVSGGLFTLLSRLEAALRSGDDDELSRLSNQLDGEIERFNLVRGEVGSRLKSLEDLEQRLLDQEVVFEEMLSAEFHIDYTETITQFTAATHVLEATLRVSAQTMQLSLMNFL